METDIKPNKPKWLQRLERESWQAELIISGAALLGTFQLPGLLERFQHYLLLNYDRSALKLWFFASSYWAIFVYGLIFVFIYHFILRALWIGLVGLNSVYPQGFVPNKLTSEDFQRKTKEAYGDIDGFINQLDHSASSMFGTGFAFAGLILNFGILLSATVLIITFMISKGVDGWVAWILGLAPVITILVLSLGSSVLSLPKLREKDWVKRYHFPFTRVISNLMYPINTRYIMTGLTLVSSNSATNEKSTLDIVKSFATSMGFMLLVGITMGSAGAIPPEFIDDVYHRIGDTPTGANDENYADSGYDGLLFEPQISTRYPKAGGALWAWVPLPERELVLLEAECTEPEVSEDLERPAKRKAERARTVKCAQAYIDLFLDDQPLATPLPERAFRTSAGQDQFGVRLELTDRMPPPGRHVLKIVTHYPREIGEKDNYRTTYLNFWVLE